MQDSFNIHVYVVEDGWEAEFKPEVNTKITGFGYTADEAVHEAFRLAGEVDTDAPQRRVAHLDEEGLWIEAQLTSEGVIVDLYSDEEGVLRTFGQTYEEILSYD